jgi:hypothetical protein
MRVIIRQWPNKAASIMSENGQLIWTFSSTCEARQACIDWHNLVDGEPVLVEEEDPTDPVTSAA